MFDIGWTELMVVAVVAILVVGPKDLPRMLRTFGQTVGKLRRMAGEFQSTFNDAIRDAEKQVDIDDMRDAVEKAGNFDPLGDIKKSLDPMKNIGSEIKSAIEKPTATAAEAAKTDTAAKTPAPAAKKPAAAATKPAAASKAGAAKKTAAAAKKPAAPKTTAAKTSAAKTPVAKPAATKTAAPKTAAPKKAAAKTASAARKPAAKTAGDGKA